MDYIALKKWLQEQKGYSDRSARDVVSRCRRIERIVQTDKLNEDTIQILIESQPFKECSFYVKSQLKRALTLYNQFQEGTGKDE